MRLLASFQLHRRHVRASGGTCDMGKMGQG